jgi:hypothetical protein
MPNLGPSAGQTKAELDRAARITDADIESARAQWREDAPRGAGRLLDAVTTTTRRTGSA